MNSFQNLLISVILCFSLASCMTAPPIKKVDIQQGDPIPTIEEAIEPTEPPTPDPVPKKLEVEEQETESEAEEKSKE